MSKANPARQSPRTPPRRGGSNQDSIPSHRKPRTSCASTQDLIARIWETLEWPKTLQVAFLIVAAGITAALVLAGLEVANHMISSQAAAWPVSITLTAMVSYQVARRRRR
jgi:hypothetical protein